MAGTKATWFQSYKNLLLGCVGILAGWGIGYVIWGFASPNFYIDPIVTLPIANLFVGLQVIPAIVVYVIWYCILEKRNADERSAKTYGYALPIILICVLTIALILVPALIWAFFYETALFLSIGTVLIIAASVIAVLFAKPY